MYKSNVAAEGIFMLKDHSDENVQVLCKPCSKQTKEKLIEAGPPTKALSNLKAHVKLQAT